MEQSITGTFIDSARIVAGLLGSAPVSERWTDESACAGMSVGGLAFHLAAQARNAGRIVSSGPVDQAPIPVEEHYRRASWVSSGPDAEVNVTIRTSADAEAASGFDALVAQVRTDLAGLPAALASAESTDPVLIPWQGWALTAHDLLVTRLMEMLVHSDDLAASIGVPTPQFPDEAVRLVLGLLTSIAVERHGQTALVRALSRPQRAPGSVSAF